MADAKFIRPLQRKLREQNIAVALQRFHVASARHHAMDSLDIFPANQEIRIASRPAARRLVQVEGERRSFEENRQHAVLIEGAEHEADLPLEQKLACLPGMRESIELRPNLGRPVAFAARQSPGHQRRHFVLSARLQKFSRRDAERAPRNLSAREKRRKRRGETRSFDHGVADRADNMA